MKKAFLITFFIFSVSCGDSSPNSNNPANSNPNNFTSYIIPSYSYPVGQYQSEWEKLYNLSTQKRVYVIVNPNNGPGNTTDANYLDAINKLKAKGFYVVGYVYTDYGNRNLEDVKNDINKWLSLYGVDKIDGFFIDEVSNNVQKFDYYKDVYTFANSKSKLIILNPGTNVDIKFFNISDKIVVFESNETDFENFQYNNYSSINSDRVCSIVLSTPANKLSFVKDKMLNNNSSCGYITDKADNWQSGDSAYFYLSPYLD
jgi:hypothetical protein